VENAVVDSGKMRKRSLQFVSVLGLLLLGSAGARARATALQIPPETPAILDKIYSFDLERAMEDARRMQADKPEHPLGYLLEAEAIWWKIWCGSAEYKYGMSDARRRPKVEADQHYLALASKISALAEKENKVHETAEMVFYAGMGDALAARLYGLRLETRNTARAAVRGREHLLRAVTLDPKLTDANLGLGLYNYYVDTLSSMAKVLRFFMGIPGGSKQEGIRLLERDIAEGELTSSEARFYLALNLHRYDQQYERALKIIGPLTERYPTNPLFQLARGDLYGKLGRKEQAIECYRKAARLVIRDAECQARIRKLARESIAAQGGAEAASEQ
jgi:tetratricopeptide (TPR) repeat protein